MANLLKRTSGGVPHYVSPQLSVFPAIRHAYFTRLGGVSSGIYESLNFRMNADDREQSALQNFAIAANIVGADIGHVARTVQKHSSNIAVVTATSGPKTVFLPDAVDALITGVPGICLAGFYADCQLLLMYDHKKRVIAVVHAGWRGIAHELAAKTIERMKADFSCRPADITVAVGPSICRGCFETDDDVPEALLGVYGDMISEYIYRDKNKWHVDLKNVTYAALLRAGIMPYNIDIANQCTCCDGGDQFWSHRRQGESRGVHAGMIVMA